MSYGLSNRGGIDPEQAAWQFPPTRLDPCSRKGVELDRNRPFLIRAQEAIDAAGGPQKLAHALGISRQAIHKWHHRHGHVPQSHVREVLQKFGDRLPGHVDAYRHAHPVPSFPPSPLAVPAVRAAMAAMPPDDPLSPMWDRHFKALTQPDPDQLELFE